MSGALLTAYGFDGTSYSYALGDFTSFSLVRSIHGTALAFSTADLAFLGSNYRVAETPDLDADLAFDAAYSYSTFQSGLNPISSNIRSADFSGSAYTDFIRIAPAPIPEPATWGLLILGFGGVAPSCATAAGGGAARRDGGRAVSPQARGSRRRFHKIGEAAASESREHPHSR